MALGYSLMNQVPGLVEHAMGMKGAAHTYADDSDMIATGYGALRRGKKQQEGDSQSLYFQFASTAAAVQEPIPGRVNFAPLVRAASTPVRIPSLPPYAVPFMCKQLAT